ncbi:cytochrome c biogenesis protein DipZ [Granulicella tundricola]|uniref:Alkyl hydroperoxide reductase/ Thiol specific antioxidant/ Mal allergen n=1 Tax=Granulicella tundricola (strain ATCC BAA-1859 / DSM 23138 / MP5ACTX9) TaxID=1198114 RepID=E8X2J4_GRATM|nr:cytochrome c biogenesis protein DipZ [Granulicella tundricola]ADW69218.1 alkyl hydroperoxide reductase/ Thiol specific antioxidant/ Mal allergen [Granulicella tundricola MP5ACTX9]
MLLLFLAYFGGILTILSPCILPVLPFVFARSDQPFRKSGLPLLTGMALTFALVASLATVGGGWAVRANQFGRGAALVLFGIFGLTLLFSSLAERVSRPIVQLGNRLSRTTDDGPSMANSFLLGIGTGLLWAPCAGPILGLILTGAALGGASVHTVFLLLAYAAGAATSLTLALLAGGKVFAAMKSSLGAEEWIRRILGVAVLAGVVAVTFGLDRGILTRLSLSSTANLEQGLLDRFHPQKAETATKDEAIAPSTAMMAGSGAMMAGNQPAMAANNAMMAANQPAMSGNNAMMAAGGAPPAADTVPTGDLSGATAWINSQPLTLAALHGKVVLIDFWTYSCINCLRTLPYIKAWNEKYKDSGLVVIGVHTPEFPFEKDESNVRKAVRDLGVTYPVAMDNDYRIWRSFNNEYWPAHYFIDATGKVRYHHFGEGGYEESENWIRSLLEEANHKPLPGSATQISASGAEAAADSNDVQSPETYVGYHRAEHFASPGGFNQNEPQAYEAPATLKLNEWAFAGQWQDERQIATSLAPASAIVYRFHARDLHLVLGPSKAGKPIRFRVTIDGKAPGADHGMDTDADGYGTVTSDRLYQLIRQQGKVQDRTFRIEFLVPGVQAYSFTFG